MSKYLFQFHHKSWYPTSQKIKLTRICISCHKEMIDVQNGKVKDLSSIIGLSKGKCCVYLFITRKLNIYQSIYLSVCVCVCVCMCVCVCLNQFIYEKLHA